MTALVYPDWPAPSHVKALTTTRTGGVSQPPYESLNLGLHVGDAPDKVMQNRQLLMQLGDLPAAPCWLEQTHSTRAIDLSHWQPGTEADACYSRQAGQVGAVMTADCLPVLFCDRQGEQVAAAHAGWRGLLNGVLEQTLDLFSGPKSDILAWLGPAIGPRQFEVGQEVFDAFTTHSGEASVAFRQSDKTHYLADIVQLARQRLNAAGVDAIYGGDYCTVSNPTQFFSYRRDKTTGRMASLIWIVDK